MTTLTLARIVTLGGVAWSDALGAVFTTAAVVALAVALDQARRSRNDRLAAAAERARRRLSSEGVCSWTELGLDGGNQVVILNGRDFPIFSVHFWAHAQMVANRRIAGVIPPGRSVTVQVPEWPAVTAYSSIPFTFLATTGAWYTWLGAEGIAANESRSRDFSILEPTPINDRPY